jgi:hypothetical protein
MGISPFVLQITGWWCVRAIPTEQLGLVFVKCCHRCTNHPNLSSQVPILFSMFCVDLRERIDDLRNDQWIDQMMWHWSREPSTQSPTIFGAWDLPGSLSANPGGQSLLIPSATLQKTGKPKPKEDHSTPRKRRRKRRSKSENEEKFRKLKKRKLTQKEISFSFSKYKIAGKNEERNREILKNK